MATSVDSVDTNGNNNSSYDLRSKSSRGKMLIEKDTKKFTSDEYTPLKENGYAANSNARDIGPSLHRLSKSKVDLAKRRAAEREERHGLVVWRRPVTTFYYFLLECVALVRTSSAIKYVRTNTRTVVTILIPIVAAIVSVIAGVVFHFYYTESSSPYHGRVQDSLNNVRRIFIWCLYWIGLGVLSSIGLGTGLHTFLLYLGPHIAAVTLAAYECNSVKFPEPPYPDDIICPYENGGGIAGGLESVKKHFPGHASDKNAAPQVNLFIIMQKVWLEAFMWGLGTAIGELPPYFLALHARATSDKQSEDVLAVPSASSIGQFNKDSALRAANIAADVDDDDDDDEDEEKPTHRWIGRKLQAIANRGRILVEELVQKVGFFGILICASIPNPLFDLAGITCGHFQVPFWKFFGATMIGKAIIKMSIQLLFVIVAFSEHHFEKVCKMLRNIPYAGPILYEPFREFLVKQKQHLHRKPGKHGAAAGSGNKSWLKFLYEWLVYVMIGYFIISIINGFAQSYHRRMHAAASGRGSRLRLSSSGVSKSYSSTKAATGSKKQDVPVRNGLVVKGDGNTSSTKRVSPSSSQQKKSNNNSKQRSGSRKAADDAVQQAAGNTSVDK